MVLLLMVVAILMVVSEAMVCLPGHQSDVLLGTCSHNPEAERAG